MRDMMLADDDLDVDAEVVRMPQHFDHAPRGVAAIFREFENLDVDDHAIKIVGAGDVDRFHADAVAALGRCGQFHALGDVDPLIDSLVVRNDIRAAFTDLELADHREMSAPQDLDNLAVSPAIALDARDMDYYAVAVHSGLRGIAWDVDIAAKSFDGTVGNEEAVPVAMHIQAADGVLAAEAGGYEMAGAHFHQVATLGQAIQRGIHIVARCTARPEFADQLLEGRAGVGELRNVLEDRGIGHLTIIRAVTLMARHDGLSASAHNQAGLVGETPTLSSDNI